MADVQIDQDAANIPAVNVVDQGSDPTAPGAGHVLLYVKSGVLYVRLSDGTVAAVGGVPSLPEGRLAVGDGDDLLSALALGTEGDVVTADASGFATWAAPAAAPGGYTEGCRIYGVQQSIANNSLQAITFASERYDTDSMHEAVTNPTRITITTSGVYLVGAHVQFASHGTGKREIDLYLNNTTTIAVSSLTPLQSGQTTYCNVVTAYSFTAGDYVEVLVYQNSGGALNVNAGASYSPEAWAQRIG